MATKESDFSFEIKEKLGVLYTYSTGWTKELNIVQWNGGIAKFDIRDWDEAHEHMSRGITLRDEEARLMTKLLSDYFGKHPKEDEKENL